ncbi:MAG: NAD(P)H-hydrate dehydratase [Clostridiales Family XIII bacterium]|jgi:NAD(P)H-hydrate epimerase|nr:NAD(P)H-hydrate dehydratase [Clostridiales Family XIII bacterium]
MSNTESNAIRVINADYILETIKPRAADIHKGQCGRLLIVAGSHGMAGAAVLCARGAFRSGAGLVSVSVLEELFPVIHGGVPEATCVGRDLASLDLSAFSAVAMGPGLGNTENTAGLVRFVLKSYGGTLVLDADALNVIAGDSILTGMLRARARRPCGAAIITPHPGEAARLLGFGSSDRLRDRTESARELAALTGAICVLKGARSLIALPEGDLRINETGNPGMATGGSGDVLTGAITALAGQGLRAEDAALAGVYLHGLAGDIAAARIGEYGLTASDIAEALALAIDRSIKKPDGRKPDGKARKRGDMRGKQSEELS